LLIFSRQCDEFSPEAGVKEVEYFLIEGLKVLFSEMDRVKIRLVR
jgi:hypothetical protein